jgi:hypothetical protein
MSARPYPDPVYDSELRAVDTNHFENGMTDHTDASFDGEVIMSDASRMLSHGSSAPDLSVTLDFCFPQDEVLPQPQTSIAVVSEKHPLPEVNKALCGNSKKRRHTPTVLQEFELTAQNSPFEWQAC